MPTHSDLLLQRMMLGWQLQQALRRETSTGTLTPSRTVSGCLSDQHGSWWGCWGPLGGVLLEESQHGEHFNSYGTAPLESYLPTVVEHGLPGHIWYSTKMPQGQFLRSCRLYAFYQGVALNAIICTFQKYDFVYNEAQIRCLLR